MPSAAPQPTVAILSAVRTPIGRFGGALRTIPVPELGVLTVRAALERAKMRPEEVDEVLIGNVIQAGNGQNVARQILRGAGIPDEVGAVTINMVCGSGTKTIHLASSQIRAGDFSRVVVGGVESMSTAPFLVSSEVRWGIRHGERPIVDAMLRDGLFDAYEEHEHMGVTGERIARKFGLTREELDEFSVRSNRRAVEAGQDGTFAREIVSVPGSMTTDGRTLERDENPRADTTLEALARLKPAFRPDGLLTAGNSSKLADGACALVLASAAEVERRGVTPLGWIHSVEESGVPPSEVMESPIPTVRKHLRRTGLDASSFDRVEHNEAFSSASVAVQRTFGFTEQQFNVHGGAIALGHPIGMSGARIVTTLAHELAHQHLSLGLATLCMGGGNGLSVIVQRAAA